MDHTANSIEIAASLGTNPIDYLVNRGFIQGLTDRDALAHEFENSTVTLYDGFDPTARSYHVGNLTGIMLLATLQRFGHRPIAVVGGGTALVGDPSGKTSTRRIPSPEEISANIPNLLNQFDPFLDFDGGRFGNNPPAVLVNNADWLLQLNTIHFLHDIGRHFSVPQMLELSSYKSRLATTGLNMVEFHYRIVQAYDFLYLYQNRNCVLQIGGADQWSNILGGVELIRKVEGKQAFALVTPLVTTENGQKMGKSEGNAVWIDSSMTSPVDYYRFWRDTSSPLIERFLKLYTFVPEDIIQFLIRTNLDLASQGLAWEATLLNHGREAAEYAEWFYQNGHQRQDKTLPFTHSK